MEIKSNIHSGLSGFFTGYFGYDGYKILSNEVMKLVRGVDHLRSTPEIE